LEGGGNYQTDVGGPHLIPQLVLKVIPPYRVVLWSTKVLSIEIWRIVEKPDHAPMIRAVAPGVADEDLISTERGA
jgi:hypothetical protein